MKVLLFGFDPFGGAKINPSYEAVKRVELKENGIELFTREVSTVFNECIVEVDKAIDELKPDVVICTGQAGGRTDITIERVGVNIIDARIPDNKGNQPVDEKIKEDGETAYLSNLPIKAIVSELRKNNIPASVSNTAGTFVCNNILYGALYLADKKYPNIKAGFIHVPFLPEQVIDKANQASMSLEVITEALRIIAETSVKYDNDIVLAAGKTH